MKYQLLKELDDNKKLKVKAKISNLTSNITYSNNITYLIGDQFKQSRSENDNRFLKAYNEKKISVGMLSLAPHSSSGYDSKEICKYHDSCSKYCVGNSGHSQMIGRIKRTVLFKELKEDFIIELIKDIAKHINNNIFYKKQMQDNGKKSYLEDRDYRVYPVIRLNGFSDIEWENLKFDLTKINESSILINNTKSYLDNKYDEIKKKLGKEEVTFSELYENKFKNIFDSVNIIFNPNKLEEEFTIFDVFPGLIFYDYTRFRPNERKGEKNYHLTYSYSKNVRKYGIQNLLKEGNNITMIHSLSNIPKEILGFQVIDGDDYDCRFLDDDQNKGIGKIILLSVQNLTKNQLEQLQDKKIRIENRFIFLKKEQITAVLKKYKNELIYKT